MSHWRSFWVALFWLLDCKLHTLIHTPPIEIKLQNLDLNQKKRSFWFRFFSQHFGLKCQGR
jgi:hypothetical protein